MHLRVIASLGKSFNHVRDLDQSDEIDALCSAQQLFEACSRHEQLFHVKHQTAEMTKQIINSTWKHNNNNGAQNFLNHLLKLSMAFLKEHSHIIVVQADKGGKTVIMDLPDYHNKMLEHIKKNITDGNYIKIEHSDRHTLKGSVEAEYKELIGTMNPFLTSDGSFLRPLLAEPYVFPAIYGCPKIHKADVPVRPIISAVNMIGDELSKWTLKKLQTIASRFEQYNVKNTISMIPDLRSFKLEEEHVLCSLDYESMYTNIDLDETLNIIAENFDAIESSTCMPKWCFIRCVSFYTTSTTFFVYEDHVYKQIRGLAMGNCLAQVLAEIRTNVALIRVLKRWKANDISIMYKYVDDILTAISPHQIERFRKEMAREANMNITITWETNEGAVDFLECTFFRKQDGSITYKWLKRDYCALQVLNHHSNHPQHMKRSIINQMSSKAIKLTSPEHMESTVDLIRAILHNSSYPPHTIDNTLARASQEPPTTRPQRKGKTTKWIASPYAHGISTKLRHIARAAEVPINIADKPTNSNRTHLFSNLKDRPPLSESILTIFDVQCALCEFTHTSTTGRWDLATALKELKENPESTHNAHARDTGHAINWKPKAVKRLRSRTELKRTLEARRKMRRMTQMAPTRHCPSR